MMFNPVVVQLYGPLAIHWYGVCIAVGVLIGFWLLRSDKKIFQMLSESDLVNLLQWSIFAGYVGGRLLILIPEASSASDWFLLLQFWQPGLSILGCVLGVLSAIFWFVHTKNISVLALMDRVVIYAPLIQACGRLGCFFAGCCYGLPAVVPWAVVYQHANHMAPLQIYVHPTQLYSALFLFGLFVVMYVWLQYRIKQQGQLLAFYLIAIAVERFLIDFFRGDRIYFANVMLQRFSVHQWVALGIMSVTVCGLFFNKTKGIGMKKHIIFFVLFLNVYAVGNDHTIQQSNAICEKIVELWMLRPKTLLDRNTFMALYARCQEIQDKLLGTADSSSPKSDRQGFVHSKLGPIVLYPLKKYPNKGKV